MASAAAGGASLAAGVAATCRFGGGPKSAGALLLPAFYATLSTRESLVLWRAAQPGTYDAVISSLLGCAPLALAPSSIRMLLAAPLLLPPLCAQWLEEADLGGGTAATPAGAGAEPAGAPAPVNASSLGPRVAGVAATLSDSLVLGASSVGGMGSSLATKAACTVAHVGEGAAEVATDMGAALLLFGGAACRLPSSTHMPAMPGAVALSLNCSQDTVAAALAAAAAAAETASIDLSRAPHAAAAAAVALAAAKAEAAAAWRESERRREVEDEVAEESSVEGDAAATAAVFVLGFAVAVRARPRTVASSQVPPLRKCLI